MHVHAAQYRVGLATVSHAACAMTYKRLLRTSGHIMMSYARIIRLSSRRFAGLSVSLDDGTSCVPPNRYHTGTGAGTGTGTGTGPVTGPGPGPVPVPEGWMVPVQ